MPKDSDRAGEPRTGSGDFHDVYFRSIFSSPAQVRNLFRLAFSEQQLEHFDMDSIEIQPSSLLDAVALREQQADLIVSVRLASGSDLLIYVLTEHKSHPDSDWMRQLLRYQAHLYGREKAAAVLPILVYHGKRDNWPVRRGFVDSCRLPGGFAKDFKKLLLDFSVIVVNLRDSSSRARFGELDSDVGLRFRFMADIWEADEATFVQFVDDAQELPRKMKMDVMMGTWAYLLNMNKDIKIKSMKKTILQRMSEDEDAQVLARAWSWLDDEALNQMLRQEYVQEGMQKGSVSATRNIAERMLKMGMSEANISEVTDLTPDEIRHLKNGVNSHG